MAKGTGFRMQFFCRSQFSLLLYFIFKKKKDHTLKKSKNEL